MSDEYRTSVEGQIEAQSARSATLLLEVLGSVEKFNDGLAAEVGKSKFGKNVDKLGGMFKNMAKAGAKSMVMEALFGLIEPFLNVLQLFMPIIEVFGAIITVQLAPIMQLLAPLIGQFVTWMWSFRDIIGAMIPVGGLLVAGIMLLINNWDSVVKILVVVGAGLATIGSLFVGLGAGVSDVFTQIYNSLMWFFNEIGRGIKAFINIIVDGINGFMNMVTIGAWADIPRLAKGGIVTKPTIAMIGEAGPEKVTPLNEADAGSFRMEAMLETMIEQNDQLLQMQRRNGGGLQRRRFG